MLFFSICSVLDLMVGMDKFPFCIAVGFLLTCSLTLKCNLTLLSKQTNVKCNQRPWWTIEPDLLQQPDTDLLQFSCPPKYFRVRGMLHCHPWLRCEDLDSIVLKELIGYGAVKAVYRAEWGGVNIAVSLVNNIQFQDDFKSGIDILRILSPNRFVIQLIGYCDENMLFTEYHQHGNARHLSTFLKTRENDNIIPRLNLCLNYAQILNFLHNSPAGKRVLCDSNSLTKLLGQLLITDAFTLVLNDVDALPEVSEGNDFAIKCGHKEISGSFVAPEQRWPHSYPFVDDDMPGYDEKTDIWKAAAVCNHFLGKTASDGVAQYYLFSLHNKCKNIDAELRPSAAMLVAEYKIIIAELSKTR